MWPFLHSILLRYIHGFAAGVEVALGVYDRLFKRRVSGVRRNPDGNEDPTVHVQCGPMALCGHHSLLAKSGIRDLFSNETFLLLPGTDHLCTEQGLFVGLLRQERGGTTSSGWWFLSPLIRGQLNDFTTNAADPDLLDGRGCDHDWLFQAD